SYEKKLIQVIKIHTDHNAADLLTKAFDVSRKAKRTTEISQFSGPIHLVADETVYREWEDRMERVATTASSLEAEQDSGSGPRCQDTILGGAEAQIRSLKEDASMSHESPLQSGRDEGSLSLHELTVLCTNLSNKVTSLEAKLAQTKQTYGTPLTKLIKKVKKLEQTVKTSQSRRRTRVVISDEEEVYEDPSK
ncbi:hypothetical protein Tco_1426466, partial [Tanacetum coccineum]